MNKCDILYSLGTPITLDRVLTALKNKAFKNTCYSYEQQENIIENSWRPCFRMWKLTKEDGFTSATQLDQSEETLSSILNLLKK
jgi:hypothetical protein